LDGLAEIVDESFAGKAQISMNTPFYSAQKD
jgi:hypothetical protein